MQLSVIGKLTETEWLKTFDLRPDMNLTMGEYVIMPNHFHTIIIIGKNEYNTDGGPGGDGGDGYEQTQCIASLPNQFGPQRKNLASIIRGFKIGVTTRARKINPHFAWQSRYHDHIIRNDKSFERICNYILSNPENWDVDRHKTD